MGNNQSNLQEQLQQQQKEYDKLKKRFEESEHQRIRVEGKYREEFEQMQQLFEQEQIKLKKQKEIQESLLDQKIAELQNQYLMFMQQQSQKHQEGIDAIQQKLASQLASKIDDMKREHDKKIAQLLKQQEEKIEETKKIIYEEIRQKQLKEAEDRRKFKEEYPVPKFLNPNVINVAITGPSGAGKSTLVNLLRGIKKGGAKTGVNECTKEPHSYTFAKTHLLHNIVYLWDLPGAGTAAFPQETYIQKMGIRWYDVVIVVGETRVRDVDVILMEELKRTLVRFVYVRTKMDNQVEANEDEDIPPQKTFQEVRENLQTEHKIERPYLIGKKYVLKQELSDWENADFVELKKVLQMMCAESADEDQKEEVFKSVLDNDSLII